MFRSESRDIFPQRAGIVRTKNDAELAQQANDAKTSTITLDK